MPRLILMIMTLWFHNLLSQDITYTNIIKEDFDESTSIFPTITNNDNYFILDNGNYLLSRKNELTEYTILPKNEELIGDFQLRTSFKIGPSSNKKASAGLVIKSQENYESITFEINKQREYRIKKTNSNKTHQYLSGKESNQGWVESKHILGENEFNNVEIICIKNTYRINVNNNLITDLFLSDLTKGKMGILISKNTKARFSYYYLDINSEEVYNHQGLSDTIIYLKNKIQEITNQKENLTQENLNLKENISSLENTTLKKNQNYYTEDLKQLESKNTDLINEISIHESHILSLKKEIIHLKDREQEKFTPKINKEIKIKNDTINILKEKVENKKNEIKEYKNKTKKLEEEINNLDLQLENIKDVFRYKTNKNQSIYKETLNTEEHKEKEKTSRKNFSVQISAHFREIPLSNFKKNTICLMRHNQSYIYISGVFEYLENAILHQKELIHEGYENAFIIELTENKNIECQ